TPSTERAARPCRVPTPTGCSASWSSASPNETLLTLPPQHDRSAAGFKRPTRVRGRHDQMCSRTDARSGGAGGAAGYPTLPLITPTLTNAGFLGPAIGWWRERALAPEDVS